METAKNNFETQKVSKMLPLGRVPCHFPETMTAKKGLTK